MSRRAKMFQALLCGSVLATTVDLAEEPLATNGVSVLSENSVSNTVASLTVPRKQSQPQGIFAREIVPLVKLLDAKLSAQVIIAYIQSSPFAYEPSADDLIKLKQHGASPEILMALLWHDEQYRAQSPPAQGGTAGPATLAPAPWRGPR